MSHQAQLAGISIIQMSTGKVIGEIRYQSSVEEIYDVRILPGVKRPNLLNTEQELYKQGLSIPEKTYWSTKSQTT
jgi:hypothetical protein